MGRTSTNPVYQYFSYGCEYNISTCMIHNCERNVKGKHGTNLEYHLSTMHPNEFTKVKLEKYRKRRNKSDTSKKDEKKNKINVLIKECVNLVTIHGRPFSLMDDIAFRNIIKMIPLNSTSQNCINAHKIRASILHKAQEIRSQIRRKVYRKLVSLKLDAATCMDRSFLGINVQFMEEKENSPVIEFLTLAVKELYGSHDATTLKNVVLNVCEEYDISIQQIYSVTTDNGANMIKLIRLLEQDQINSSEIEGDDESDVLTVTWDEEHDNIFFESENNSDEENEESNISAYSSRSTLHENIMSHFSVQSVRCAAHTLQLAIADVLKDNMITQTINRARYVCKKLRTPTIRRVLKAMDKRKPIVDCVTRWHSTLDMIERLIELKSCCDESNKNLYLSPETWNELESIVKCLMPARIATKQLQEEQLTIGDFYRVWTSCILQTTKIHSKLSGEIVNAMKKRQTQLFESDIFIAGMFLDTRYNVVLSPQEVIRAKMHLMRTWKQLSKLENLHCTPNNDVSISLHEGSDSEIDDIEALMKELEEKTKKKSLVPLLNVKDSLDTFAQLPRLKSKHNILQFWQKNKHTMPQLYKLANIVLAVPSTQVSVERLFSSLKYILSPLRTNLRDNVINDVLLIRANKNKLLRK